MSHAAGSSSSADRHPSYDLFIQHGLPPNSALRHLPALPRSPSSRRLETYEHDDTTHESGHVRRMASVQQTPRRQHVPSGSRSGSGLEGIEMLDELSPPRPHRVPSTPATGRVKQHKDVFEGRAYPVLSTRQSLTNLARTITEAKLIAASIPLPPSPVKEVSALFDPEPAEQPSDMDPAKTTVERVLEAPLPQVEASGGEQGDHGHLELDDENSLDSESFELDIEALRPRRTPALAGLPLMSDLGYRQMDAAKSVDSPSKPARTTSTASLETMRPDNLLARRDDHNDGPSILLSPPRAAAQETIFPNSLFLPLGPRMTSRAASTGAGGAGCPAAVSAISTSAVNLFADECKTGGERLDDGPSVDLAPAMTRTPARTPRHGNGLMPPRALDIGDTSTLLPTSPARFAHLLADDRQIARVEFDEEPSVFLAPPVQTPRRNSKVPAAGGGRPARRLHDMDAGDRSTLLPVTPARSAHLLDDQHQIARESFEEEPSVFLAPPTETPRRGTTMPPPRSARMTSRSQDCDAGDRSTLLPVTPARVAHLLHDRHQIASEEFEEEPTMLLAPPMQTPKRGTAATLPAGSARMISRLRAGDAGDRSTLLPVTPARVAHLLNDDPLIAREELIEEDSMWLPPPTPRTAPGSTTKPKTPRPAAAQASSQDCLPSSSVRAAAPTAQSSRTRPRDLAIDDTMDLGEMMALVARPKRPSGTEESFVDLLHGADDFAGMDESIGDESFLPVGLRPGTAERQGLPLPVQANRSPIKSVTDDATYASSDRLASRSERNDVFAQLGAGPVPARQSAYQSIASAEPPAVKRTTVVPTANTTSTSVGPARLSSIGGSKRAPLSVGSRPMPTSASARELALPGPAPSARVGSLHKRSESLNEAGRARLAAAPSSRPAMPVARSSSVRLTAATTSRPAVPASQTASRLPSRAPVSGLPRPGTMGPPAAVARPADRLSARIPSAAPTVSSAAGTRTARSFGTDLNSAMNAAPRLSRPPTTTASSRTAVPLTKRSAGPPSTSSATIRTQRIPSGSGVAHSRALSTPATGISARPAASVSSASSRLPGPAAAGRPIARASDAPACSTLSRRPPPSAATGEPRSRAGSATTLSRVQTSAPTRSLSTTQRGLPVPSRSADLLSLRDKVDRLAARQTAARLQR